MKVVVRISLSLIVLLSATLASAEPRTSERFFLEKNGGGLEVLVIDPADKTTRDAVQDDLRQAAMERTVLDSPELQQHADRINYRFEKTERGARVRITAKDEDARRSIKEYLKSRIGHQEPAPVAFNFIQDTSLVAIPVMINGSGPYRFLLDTGATHSVISATAADFLKIKIGRRDELLSAGGKVPITMRTLDSIQIGDALLESIEIAVANFSLLKDLAVDGILGADYLRRFKIAIDYENKLVEIETAADSMSMALG